MMIDIQAMAEEVLDFTNCPNDVYRIPSIIKILEESLFLSGEQHLINVMTGNNYIDDGSSFYTTNMVAYYLSRKHNLRFKFDTEADILDDNNLPIPNSNRSKTYILVKQRDSHFNRVEFTRVNYNT